jgi:TonB family protein
MSLRFAAVAALGVLTGASSARAAGTDLEKLLAAPLSPGSVALLVRHAQDPRVSSRWAVALKDSRPEVRAAAGRAVNVLARTALLADLLVALRIESDEMAALEEARAAIALGTPPDEIRAATQRHSAIQPALELALRARDAVVGAGTPAAAAKGMTASRIPSGFPPGLVRDVLQVAGCRDRGKEDFHGGQVEYGPENRPRRVTMLAPHGVSVACMDAVEALLFLALRPGMASREGAVEFVVVPLARDAAACLGEVPAPGRAGVAPTRVGGGLQEPKRIRTVNPWYPAGARDERVEGVVVLEATIAPSGCVSEVRVLHGRDPRLNLVAMLTVAQWAYTPTLLDGVPVPVIMTVTVNFRLS